MSHKSVTVLFLALWATLESGQDCAEIADPDERLECYDSATAEPEPEPEEKSGEWELVKISSKGMSDRSSWAIINRSEQDEQSGSPGGEAWMEVWCTDERTMYVKIGWDVVIGSGRPSAYGWSLKVVSRLDENPAKNSRWSASDDRKGIVLWTPRFYIMSLKRHDVVRYEVFPPRKPSIVSTFNLAGLKPALKNLRRACGL